jgi:hypothetical protein
MNFAQARLPPPGADDGIAPLVRRRDGVECFVHPSQIGVELRGTRLATMGRAKAVGLAGREVLWVRERDDASWLEGPGHHPEFAPSRPGRAFFGWPGKSEDLWLLGLPTMSSHWKIHTERTSVTLAPPSGTEVMGIVQGPALLLREANERSLLLLGIHRNSKLPPLADPVSDACACPSAPFVAYCSGAGELIVYSLERDATVLHVLPNGERPS